MAYATTPKRLGWRAKFRKILCVPVTIIFGGAGLTSLMDSRSAGQPLDGATLFLLVVGGVSIWKQIKWGRISKALKRFPLYVKALNAAKTNSTAELANQLNSSQAVVIRNLQLMSKMGLMPAMNVVKDGTFTVLGADEKPLIKWQEAAEARDRELENKQKQNKPLVERGYRCASCGAQHRISGSQATPCPYCGTLPTIVE